MAVADDLKQIIRDRLLGILFSQTFDIVDRGIGTPADLNFGCQVALGFRKGPLDIMRDLAEVGLGGFHPVQKGTMDEVAIVRYGNNG